MNTLLKMDNIWDNINIGRMDLNHSEGFFKVRHLEHERLENLLKKKMKSAQENIGQNDKENTENGKKDEIQKIVESTVKSMSRMTLRSHIRQVLVPSNPSRLMNYAHVYEQHKKDLADELKKEEEKKLVKNFKARPAPKFVQAKASDNNKENKVVQIQNKKQSVPKNAVVAKKIDLTGVKPKPPVARVGPYRKAADVTDKANTKEAVTKPIPAKMRPSSIRSKSVPSTSRQPLYLSKKSVAVTETTKPTIKNFTAKVPKYLYKEPFKPVKKLEKREPTEVKPFTLTLGTRVDSRIKSDGERRKKLEEKNKQMLEENLKKELEEIKALRRTREFRATVNPFKKAVSQKNKTEPDTELTPIVEQADIVTKTNDQN